MQPSEPNPTPPSPGPAGGPAQPTPPAGAPGAAPAPTGGAPAPVAAVPGAPANPPKPAAPAAAPAAAAKPAAAAAPAKIVTVVDLGDDDDPDTEVLDDPAEISDLKKIDIFADIQESTLQMYPGMVARRRYKAGDIICNEGDGGTTAFYVVEGEVDISIKGMLAKTEKKGGGLIAALGRLLGQGKVSSSNARSADALVPVDAGVDLKYGKLVATLGKGEVFGEMSCLSRAPRSATAKAKTDVVMLEILRTMYEKLQASKTFKQRTEENYRNRALAGHLRNVSVFESLPDSAIERLKTKCELLTVEPGQVIIKEADAADSMFIIRLGQVRVSKKLAGGELTLAYLTKGDCFGEIGLLSGTKRLTTCTAYSHPKSVQGTVRTKAIKPSRVELVKIKQADFNWVTAEFPDVKAKLEVLAGARLKASEAAQKQIADYKAPTQVEDLGLLQGQGLLLIDLEKCTRCDQCVQACVESHDDGVTRLVREGPRYDNYLVPSRCRMCLDPVCMIGCPVGSIRRTKDLNMLIEDWCIGCGVCATQCPYNSIQMHNTSEFAPKAEQKKTAAPERKEKAIVCDQCSSLPQGPACVYSCPHDAAFRINAREFFQVSVQGRVTAGV